MRLHTEVLFIMHVAEENRTSGSARLANLALSNSQIFVHGKSESVAPLPPLQDDGKTFVLFPSQSAPELSPPFALTLPKPIRLVVPDGNWHQARRMTQRIPQIVSLPRVRVAADPPSRYVLRKAPHQGVLCTLEAVARALGVLEGLEVQYELERLLALMMQRTLTLRRGGTRDSGHGGHRR